ncbi:hypothetical protein IW262DRAFT_1448328 [Armillaria fumosa]|nr:hypothetical protein IW262DRAFT_1448328 [Armillaria fumosa]
MIIWIRNSLSPQQVCDHILSDDSEFRLRLIRYLESVHKGEYLMGYVDFTEVLPESPPPHCEVGPSLCSDCDKGNTTQTWWGYFKRMVDMIINKCCMDNKWGRCKAHFPYKLFGKSVIDPETRHINLMKKEQWINSFAPLLSYIFRCNTDLTSLQSGTAIKAVLIYVTDYITKPGLKTHTSILTTLSKHKRIEPGN